MINTQVSMVGAVFAAVAIALSGEPAVAKEPTAAQKAACRPDAFRLCSEYIGLMPDYPKIRRCLKDNFKALSPPCKKVYEVGFKERGMPIPK